MIELRNITKIYDSSNVVALDDVTLSIENGEFVSIVGHSGSGKSTLMNILGCLDTQTYGQYILDNKLINTQNDNTLARLRSDKIGFIFQGFNLIPTLTAFENVELPLMYRGISKAKRRYIAENALDKVHLSDRLNHRPNELSGGQQQRVAIARAVATKPPIILADEPTGNLDYNACEDVMQLLSELNKEGKTVIVITHDKLLAKRFNRSILIDNGKVQ